MVTRLFKESLFGPVGFEPRWAHKSRAIWGKIVAQLEPNLNTLDARLASYIAHGGLSVMALWPPDSTRAPNRLVRMSPNWNMLDIDLGAPVAEIVTQRVIDGRAAEEQFLYSWTLQLVLTCATLGRCLHPRTRRGRPRTRTA